MRQIIAIGGGGFGRVIKDLKIENYIKSQCKSDSPKICFIPTATGDDNQYIENFYKAFDSIGCKTSHIDFFKRTINLVEHIKKQDIIFVGGGNTKSMLAVWKDWGLDALLEEAYKNGVIMCGVSAGAICWFNKGITDSWADDLAIMDCLGFVDGVCCPHYDEEPTRRPYVKDSLDNADFDECIGVEGNAALHIINEESYKSVNFGDNKNSYRISLKDNIVDEDPFESIKI
ncbi:peptidase E [Gammaproteobacteria bacterium]|nr:peptidase E [Gammaproteobacteria bacterium]MDB9861727.1 peptidase E [Gammaproteobacteria bacterium]